MRLMCTGYLDEAEWDAMTEAARNPLIEDGFAYDDELRRGGHCAGTNALQSARNTATLRLRNGSVDVTDGPFTETQEQIGGLLILEADAVRHAIALMSKHPDLKNGPFEIRAAHEELNAQIEARNSKISSAESVRRAGYQDSSLPFRSGVRTMKERQVHPMPSGMHSVSPHLICDGAADVLEFSKKAFGRG